MSHSSLQATAARLIDKHGRTVTFCKAGTTERVAGKAWQGVTDTVDSEEPGTEHDAKAVFVGYREKQIDGTNIKRGDKRCLVDGTHAAIETFDALRDTDESIWKFVEAPTILEPGAVRLLYEIQVRQ